MSDLFFWQLIGDLFKITSFILAYILLAKAMTFHYIISEIIFNILYVILSIVLIGKFGLKGGSFAFAINYFMYLIFMVILFRKLLFKSRIE
jgi:PST family polysaccharide transporter